MRWEDYETELTHICADLKKGKKILVVEKNMSFAEIEEKIKTKVSNFNSYNLNFSNSISLENDFYEDNFDKIYVLSK